MLILKYIANTNLICTFVLDAMIFDPDSSTFLSVGSTTYPHKGAGCALFYSPKHKNRPTVFIGGSNDTSFDNHAEILDYTVNNSIWEKRMYTHCLDLDLNGLLTRHNFFQSQNEKNF